MAAELRPSLLRQGRLLRANPLGLCQARAFEIYSSRESENQISVLRQTSFIYSKLYRLPHQVSNREGLLLAKRQERMLESLPYLEARSYRELTALPIQYR
jgi:hypothetical protein